ncbi:putative glyoxylase family protein (Lactoylglutathione lyase) [Candidatus Burkholderia verschuerenii]|uniref:Putative glyoxylase family protein (Lactoylglutathione lyase) n=1 Tax=Candidatus Burkholderia verschuerenii TaxID=242163 RepID=A0A0L0MG64_9BURK|nr:VOC family protein [Candidatus Burkholderia verschuerenii]KND61280.1 putative glyoxylase family protein (Lactoylglutathione lyase) [Candidatus Burkholderia verschuerenii]
MNIAHIALWTRDLDAAAQFWRRYFQADVGAIYRSERRPGFASRFVRLPGERTSIELMTGPWIAHASADECVGWDHLAISLGSATAVDALAARCAADSLLVSPPRTTGDGFYEAVIATPDGTRIEITA